VAATTRRTSGCNDNPEAGFRSLGGPPACRRALVLHLNVRTFATIALNSLVARGVTAGASIRVASVSRPNHNDSAPRRTAVVQVPLRDPIPVVGNRTQGGQPRRSARPRQFRASSFYMEVGEGQVPAPASSVAIHVAIQRTNRPELLLRRVFARQIRTEIDRFRHF
jgi:hypothetical protein